jgi:hypothetical protein
MQLPIPLDKLQNSPELVEVYTLNALAPTILVPSADNTSDWNEIFVRRNQFVPKSDEVYTFPFPEAASFIPSAEAEIASHRLVGAFIATQVVPESAEV